MFYFFEEWTGKERRGQERTGTDWKGAERAGLDRIGEEWNGIN